MNLSKSIDFLLENSGDVIKYRLHKEILRDVSKTEEENLLEKVLQMPNYKLVEKYRKPSGYIGFGMHSWDNFRDFHKETRMQDGEYAARLLSNYSIPTDSPIVKDFVAVLRDEKMLEQEFSYISPEIPRFQNRFIGLGCGGALMCLIYTCQALMGCGDDEEVKPFVETSYKAFENVLNLSCLEDLGLKRNKKWVYVEPDALFPCQYHLETLAHTASWRNEESVNNIVKAINHHDEILDGKEGFTVKVGSRYYVPYWAYTAPFKEFTGHIEQIAGHRKTLTHLAMVGGEGISAVRRTAEFLAEALSADGILRVEFESAYQKKCYRDGLVYPGPYSEVSLEAEHKKDLQIWTELTFWAVQFMHLLGYKL